MSPEQIAFENLKHSVKLHHRCSRGGTADLSLILMKSFDAVDFLLSNDSESAIAEFDSLATTVIDNLLSHAHSLAISLKCDDAIKQFDLAKLKSPTKQQLLVMLANVFRCLAACDKEHSYPVVTDVSGNIL